jgi:Fe-S oxidoreductase
MRYSPFACELIDRLILEGAGRNITQSQNLGFVSGDPGAILVIEIRGDHQDDVLRISGQIQAELQAIGLGYHFPVLFEPETKKVWELRRAGLGVVSNVPGNAKPCTVIEDTAVAIEDLPAYIAEMHQLLNGKYGLECVHYAHAGAGEIHLRPVLNLKTEEGRKLFRKVAVEVAALVKKWNGSLSGEHGDGRLRGEFLRDMIGPVNYELCCKVKSLFDPQNIFNPGKIVNAPPMDQDLRFPLGTLVPSVDTVFDFSDTHGFLGAAEMCSGSGDCRKTHLAGGTMCPSYMATRNEYDSTRARANLLRQALTDPTNARWPLDNREAKDVLDLCLSCKACKSECPSNVDMAKMKAEFTQAYYDRHGVPLRARLVANYSRLNRWMALAPSLYNWASQNPIMSRWIKSLCGFHPNRSLPKLGSQTLRTWQRKHKPHPNAGSVGTVTLFCDEFTNYNDFEVGQATVELLESLGYQVHFVKHDESGRAAISKGLLRKARAIAERNVVAFADKISINNPLIGIEPSAILTFRDEYVSLLRGSLADSARQLAANCLLLDEFIAQETLKGNIRSAQFSDQTKIIRLHGHCHQKATASLAPSVQMLQLPKNYRVRLIPSGCCGMAGSFGYEQEHFDTANRIGELVLMPTIRAEPVDSLIAAAGTSCRHQILDATGRHALHPAQILRDALLRKS